MTSPLHKSHPITARKDLPIQEVDSGPLFDQAERTRFPAAARECRKSSGWRSKWRVIQAGFFAAGLLISLVEPNEGFAQQSLQDTARSRNFAPPVHISPGSATALPPNRHRPKLTPGLEIVKPPLQRESIGIQDRLAQHFSSHSRQSRPAPARQMSSVRGQGQVVGSGVLRGSVQQSHELTEQEIFVDVVAEQSFENQEFENQGHSQTHDSQQSYSQPGHSQQRNSQQLYTQPAYSQQGQQNYAHQQYRQAHDDLSTRSILEEGRFEVDLPDVPRLHDASPRSRSVQSSEPRRSVRPVMAQDGEMAPVRHAFVQEQYLRNQLRENVQLDDSSTHEPFDQSLEWSDEPAISSQRQPASGRIPARSTSILSRQDGDEGNGDLRPQPANQDDRPSAGFQDEMDRLDRQFEQRKLGTQNDPESLPEQADRPRSLLDLNDDSKGRDREDDDLDDEEGAKTSLLDRTCDEFRTSLLNTSIRDIALDISPPAINTDQNYMGISRSWTDRHGQIISTGTMVDMRRGYVFLDNGQKIAFARLSEPDLAAVSEHWNIPNSCLVSSVGTVERCWQPQSYQWTASSLCHKPLYFENIQLERYGHSHGPIMQPVRSVAHFFVSLATLPYHTAIHPPNECSYALGLYRPGDCAPWLKDPIPISLDGMRRQALVTTGLAFIP